MGTPDHTLDVAAVGLDESMLDALFAGHVEEAAQQQTPNTPAPEEDSPELLAVSRRIASNYIQILADASQQLLHGGDPTYPLATLESAITDLTRLSTATDDVPMQERLAEAREEIDLYRERNAAGRGHNRFRDFLRNWLPLFAGCTGDGEAVLKVVEFDLDQVPVFRDLMHLPGIGPRRLGRLYAAGLYDAKTIATASPQDMAAVTGLPRSLCEEVVERASASLRERAVRAISQLPVHLGQFWTALEDSQLDWDHDLYVAARRSLLHLRLAGERAANKVVEQPTRAEDVED